MTYCVGMLVETGLVMIADTRTNAGVDNISTYRKLHMLRDDDDAIVVAMTAGNLSVTQTAMALLREGLPAIEEGGQVRRPEQMPTLFRIAQLVGEAVHRARSDLESALQGSTINTGVSILLGGRVGDEPLRLYMVYSQGNFIECQPEAPFLQIGETKYGKPILDRALNYTTPLGEAVKVGLISFDSTIRSNLAVGRPLDLIAIPADRTKPIVRRHIDWDDRYFNDLSVRWGMLLNEARATIPDPPFMPAD
ncbi:peptidase [Sphingobium boeckii]|uniref:Putative proteasome-type protease n=1 Tax=Sphingobium boeckii TaxID=1082345 RepID=A0A7W9AIE3_9SPHN|nr:peptidase [Sphingobium boeckii]MBB5686143.1 putative proteasome-type protease [Sphingobium boeckii]